MLKHNFNPFNPFNLFNPLLKRVREVGFNT